jgi:ornithine cyclodeaminase/alanine dehydrogenase
VTAAALRLGEAEADVDGAAAWGFAEEASKRFDLDVMTVGTPQEAVANCDPIVTAGPILKKPHCTSETGWMDEGAFASLVDFDSYWHPEALKEVDKFCTDDMAQLRHYERVGYFQNIPPVYADLGEIVAGKKPGRQSAAERTMTANLGLAMDDMAVAPTIYARAVEKKIGTWLPL